MGGITGSAVGGANSLADILNYWDEIGVFMYVLPFLLIFAVVYGILQKSLLFGAKKGIDAVIGIAIGLIALQFDIVSNFYSTVFPYLGIGLSLLLVFIIMTGLFGDWGNNKNILNKVLFWVGVIIAVFIVISSLTDTSAWVSGNWWNNYSPAIITLIVIIALVWAVIGGRGEEEGQSQQQKGK